MPGESQDCFQEPRQARFANYFEIGFNAHEFVLVFGQAYEPQAEGMMHTWIVTSPVYLKMLQRRMASCVRQYEEQYGPIPSIEEDPGGAEER